MRNVYQRPATNRKYNFLISCQAHNDQKSTKDQQWPNNNPAITHSNLITAEAMKSTLKQFTHMIDYNGNSDSDSNNNVEFADIDLPCNKLSVQLLGNDFITRIKKRHVFKTEDKADKSLKTKIT